MAVAGTVLQAASQAVGSDLEAELQQQQLETNSRSCQSLDDLRRELRGCRAAAATAAGRAGAQVAALGTSPVPVEPEPVRTSRRGLPAGRLRPVRPPVGRDQQRCRGHGR